MPVQTPKANAITPTLWAMLLALTSGFALSNAYRTVAAILAAPLSHELGLSPQALGIFAASFHFMFGAMQLFMGIALDLWGVRRTVLLASPLTIVGAVISATAPGYGTLLLGQALIGIGCSPAFLACTVFISRHFPASRFAPISGMAMAIGTLGMLFTGTPLAWLVQSTSWRMAYVVLAVMSLVAWLAIWRAVREPVQTDHQAHLRKETVSEAVARFGSLFLMPHTWSIVVLGFITYAAFISLRGLWLGPLLISRYDFSLVQSGNVALVLSLMALCGPMVFGRIDPGPQHRRRWLVVCTLMFAALFALIGFAHNAWTNIAAALTIGFLSGFLILQYADVRSAYPAALTGRAMAAFTMAMFLGVAAMQWFTGLVASLAQARALEPFGPVMYSIAALLVMAALAFTLLPSPPKTDDKNAALQR
ncbi:MFS transporter [Diaphorobacter aerolatus]|uniref:MFS transporter n=1 Tax=Diaphorobacter aerolatus TaxID=1288495 RepID=A0A7H0GIJ5_9BURK|nr:MFS transporter [Diaphorobacter aerolatus]QNP48111.1 MFS transporter [Diaphorobacter aerolatus]